MGQPNIMKCQVTNLGITRRFPVSKEESDLMVLLMKTLMVHVIYPIVNEVTGCLLAEVDRKLFNVLGKLGIIVSQLAPSINYLASETIPVYSISEAISSTEYAVLIMLPHTSWQDFSTNGGA